MYPKVDESYPTPPPPPPPPPPPLVPPSAPPTTAIDMSSIGPCRPSAPPGVLYVRSPVPAPWSTGLCDCTDDVGNCCVTCLCPCITFGQIAEIIDHGSTSCGASGVLYALILCATGCQCLYSCFYRSKLRGQYFLEESPFADCVVHCCCESCALCQEYRELKRRGFDMHLGWQGNMERPDLWPRAAPPVEGGMRR